KSASVLFVSANYRLSNDADMFEITSQVFLFPNNDALRATIKKPVKKEPTAWANALYYNFFLFEAPVQGATANRDQNIAALSANNGAQMRILLDMGAKRMAEMVAADLEGGEQADAAAATVTVKNPLFSQMDAKGKLVKEDNDGRLVRTNDGNLFYGAKAGARP
ncbi:MAG TPA: hypothetical protein VG501_07890, partial [Rhizomicrobium sp.]|nr:hypothetical protein [Rhizomicrobium sp.]